jgi:hypothetical protein
MRGGGGDQGIEPLLDVLGVGGWKGDDVARRRYYSTTVLHGDGTVAWRPPRVRVSGNEKKPRL